METQKCIVCNKPIPTERLEALPHTIYCVEHSTTHTPKGFLVYSHKTAPELIIIPPSPEAMRQARRAHRRAR